MPSSDEITVRPDSTTPAPPAEREPDLREIDFRLKADQRRADWGLALWVQIGVYGMLIGFVALAFWASMWVLSMIGR